MGDVVDFRRDGSGRQARDVEELRDVRDELAALRRDALALVDALLPIADRFEWATREIGPQWHQQALVLQRHLLRFERRLIASAECGECAAGKHVPGHGRAA